MKVVRDGIEIMAGLLRDRRLRTRAAITIGALVLYRLLAHVPTPGLSEEASPDAISQALGALSLLGGSAAGVVSLVALGVGPLVTAAIVSQVAEQVIPAWRARKHAPGQKEARARSKRRIAVVISAAQAVSLALSLRREDVLAPGVEQLLLVVFSLWIGSLFTIWLADRISRDGFGQGVSLLIVCGVVPAIVSSLQAWSGFGTLEILLGVAALLGLAAATASLFLTERRLPILVGDVRARRLDPALSYLPIGANLVGVLPVIFAAAVLSTGLSLLGSIGATESLATALLGPSSWGRLLLEAGLIGLFTLSYASFVFDPFHTADDLSRRGAFIPGLRPGDQTAEELGRQATRMIRRGALVLSGLVLLPGLLGKLAPALPALPPGSSLVILFGVCLLVGRRLWAEGAMSLYRRRLEAAAASS